MTIFIDTGDNTEPKRILRVRKAAEGVTTLSCGDDIIIQLLTKSDTWIQVITNKFDWVETDKQWESVLEASENRTASKIDGISHERYTELVADYNKTTKALTGKDKELKSNTIGPISVGFNTSNELAPENYIPIRDEFPH